MTEVTSGARHHQELVDVIRQSTWNPAREIKQEQLGNLSVGAIADVAEHSAMRQELARRARVHAYEQYGIARMIDAHRRLYLSLCGQRAS